MTTKPPKEKTRRTPGKRAAAKARSSGVKPAKRPRSSKLRHQLPLGDRRFGITLLLGLRHRIRSGLSARIQQRTGIVSAFRPDAEQVEVSLVKSVLLAARILRGLLKFPDDYGDTRLPLAESRP